MISTRFSYSALIYNYYFMLIINLHALYLYNVKINSNNGLKYSLEFGAVTETVSRFVLIFWQISLRDLKVG